jgi:hypothetical protein
MSTLIDKHNSGDVAAVELDFVQVMSVLPNRKITAPGDAAVGIAFRDTGDKHAREKIGTPFLNLCRRILRHIDLRVDLLSGIKSESAQSLETSSHHYTGR